MKVRALVVSVWFVFVGVASAQDSTAVNTLVKSQKTEYFFYIQSGTLIGCNECSRGKELSFSGATVHGVKIGNRLRVGAGIGYDSYFDWNHVPAFGSVSWDLFARKNAFFIQFSYGGTLKSWKYSLYDEYGYQKSTGGQMMNPMVGYRIRYHEVSISLMAGYKFQRMATFYEYPSYYWDPARGQVMGDPMTTEINREMNRFMLSLAIGWK